MPDIFSYISIPILILFSAFFSASEIAFASVNAVRLKSINKNDESLAVFLATKIHEDYQKILTSIVVGNTLVNIAASSVATVIIISLFGQKRAYLSTVIMTVIVLIFGEVVPKVVAKSMPEKFSVAFSIPLYIISFILRPLTFIFIFIIKIVSKLWENNKTDTNSVSEDDLENIIEIVEDEGVLDEDQCDLLQNALEFDDVCAYEIITPRVDMEAINIQAHYENNYKKILASNFSRIPVFEETPDNIIGILHVNHFLKESIDKEKVSIRNLILPTVFVHKTMPLPDVLEKMREAKCHLAVVLDEYGGTMGIITMEDVLEQLVGEIFDENDDITPEFICIDDSHFEAIGDMRLVDFFDEFDIDIEEDEEFENDNSTVGGFVTTMLEGETSIGNAFTYKNLLISVLEADEKRVDRVSAEILEEIEED
ncbi:MAG: hemolysin family protein [Clostridia bacterium]|nr:hemolysin family protein [Clostridia bacterium]